MKMTKNLVLLINKKILITYLVNILKLDNHYNNLGIYSNKIRNS